MHFHFNSKFLALKIPQIIRNSLNVVEDYQKGIITNLDDVQNELLINVLIIIGVAIIAGFLFLFSTSLALWCSLSSSKSSVHYWIS